MSLSPDEIQKAKDEAIEPAKEVLSHLYKALLAVPPFTLADGTKAEVEAYYAPEVNDAGELKCGVDVVLDNGNHLEFTFNNSGWGKSFAAALKPRPQDRGPRR
jgi:hypothetical protein